MNLNLKFVVLIAFYRTSTTGTQNTRKKCRINLGLKGVIQASATVTVRIIIFYIAESFQVHSSLIVDSCQPMRDSTFNSKDLLSGDQEVFLWFARKIIICIPNQKAVWQSMY